MNRFKSFTGGMLETNCFLYPAPGGNILFDAPDGAADHFADEKIDLLVITHGHFDHVLDAARIIEEKKCRTIFHPLTAPLVAERNFAKRFGISVEIEPFQADETVEEGGLTELLGAPVRVFHVPGHCPGSLCILLPEESVLIGGDVLFREAIGRWDLPGGDLDLLVSGIRTKLFPLGDEIIVFPGHGPATTIGYERANNPFVAE